MSEGLKTALITGASAGIGRMYAIELAYRGGWNLVLVARRAERLEQLKAEIEDIWESSGQTLNATVIPTDLGSPAQRARMLTEIGEQDIAVDLLINNAGFGSVGDFTRSNLARESSMVEVNCRAPLHLMHHFLDEMRARRSGAIINVASTASFQAMPYMATYGATKAFLRSLSLAIAQEVQQDGITVLAQCPGPTESEFHLAAGLPKKMSFLPGMSAEQVVKEALNAVEKEHHVIVHGWLNCFLAFLNRLFPLRFSAYLVERTLRRYS